MRKGTTKDMRWNEPPESWPRLRLIVRHRGAPGDVIFVGGARVTGLGSSFFEVDGETSIPYHRIQKIYWGDELLFERASSSSSKSDS
jgi:uncharacterized protein (UPF0248 family)